MSDNSLHNYCVSLSSPRHAYQLFFFSKPPLRLCFLLYVKSKGVKDGQDNVFTFYLQRAIVVVPKETVLNFRIQKLIKKGEKPQAPQAQNTWCMRQLVYIKNCMGK